MIPIIPIIPIFVFGLLTWLFELDYIYLIIFNIGYFIYNSNTEYKYINDDANYLINKKCLKNELESIKCREYLFNYEQIVMLAFSNGTWSYMIKYFFQIMNQLFISYFNTNNTGAVLNIMGLQTICNSISHDIDGILMLIISYIILKHNVNKYKSVQSQNLIQSVVRSNYIAVLEFINKTVKNTCTKRYIFLKKKFVYNSLVHILIQKHEHILNTYVYSDNNDAHKITEINDYSHGIFKVKNLYLYESEMLLIINNISNMMYNNQNNLSDLHRIQQDKTSTACVGIKGCPTSRCDLQELENLITQFKKKFNNYNTHIQDNILRAVLNNNINSKTKQKTILFFYGSPGTGKTRAAKCLSDILKLPLVHVSSKDIEHLYEGDTKKIYNTFEEKIKGICPLFVTYFNKHKTSKIIIFIDEIFDNNLIKIDVLKKLIDPFHTKFEWYPIKEKIDYSNVIIVLASNNKPSNIKDLTKNSLMAIAERMITVNFDKITLDKRYELANKWFNKYIKKIIIDKYNNQLNNHLNDNNNSTKTINEIVEYDNEKSIGVRVLKKMIKEYITYLTYNKYFNTFDIKQIYNSHTDI
jgi:DNA polymerase III delta prime subunit